MKATLNYPTPVPPKACSVTLTLSMDELRELTGALGITSFSNRRESRYARTGVMDNPTMDTGYALYENLTKLLDSQ